MENNDDLFDAYFDGEDLLDEPKRPLVDPILVICFAAFAAWSYILISDLFG